MRRLRELLTLGAQSRKTALFFPEFCLIGDVPEVLSVPSKEIASERQSVIALENVLPQHAAQLAQFNPLFDSEDVSSSSVLRVLAKELFSVWKVLLGKGVSIGSLVTELQNLQLDKEAERFQVFSDVFSSYEEVLAKNELIDRYLDRIRRRRLTGEFRNIFLIGCVDFPEVTANFLSESSFQPLCFAPDSAKDGFDRYGRTTTRFWSERRYAPPDDACLFVERASDGAYAAVSEINRLSDQCHADEIVLGLIDEEFRPHLQLLFDQYGVDFHEVAQPNELCRQVASLVRLISEFQVTRSFRILADLVRHPSFSSFSSYSSEQMSQLLIEMDSLQAKTLCRKVKRPLPFKEFPLVSELLDRLEVRLVSEKELFAFTLEVLTEASLASEKRLETEAITGSFESFCHEIESFQTSISSSQVRDHFFDWMESIEENPVQSLNAIEGLGWLELALDDARAVAVLGLSDHLLPASMYADKYLPGRIRELLSLPTTEARAARDRFLTELLVNSKDSVKFIVHRTTDEGDTNKLSRLMYGADQKQNATRFLSFMESAQRREPLRSTKLGRGDQADGALYQSAKAMALEASGVRSLSVSDFTLLMSCPFFFLLNRELGASCTDDTERELDPLSFGNLFHECAYQISTKPKFSLQQVNPLIDKVCERYFKLPPETALPIQRELLKVRVLQFLDWHTRRREAGWNVIHAEYDFAQNGLVELPHGAGSTVVRGRIDRIEQHAETKEVVVIDYKTSEKGVSPRSAHLSYRGEWRQLQLPLYRFAIEQIGLSDSPSLAYLNVSSELTSLELSPFDLSEEEYSSAMDLASELAEKAAQGSFWPPAEDSPVEQLDELYEVLKAQQ